MNREVAASVPKLVTRVADELRRLERDPARDPSMPAPGG